MCDTQNTLKRLHRAKTVRERGAIIREVEQTGGTIAFLNNCYIISIGNTSHILPWKVCEHCSKPYRLYKFWGKQGAEYPWCEACRKTYPKEAKKAYDHARFHARYQAMSHEERASLWHKVESKKQTPPGIT